jgi:hypothetical protein
MSGNMAESLILVEQTFVMVVILIGPLYSMKAA